MEYVTRDGVRLAYAEAGRGDPPILLVHGMQCDHTHMQPLFDHFARKHRVVSIDLRGHGASDKPESDYSNAMFNDDIGLICSSLGLRRPVGIGHSFGGSTLLHMAVHRPGLLGGIVLLDSGVRSAASRQAELGPAHGAVSGPEDRAQSARFLAARLFGPDDPVDLRDSVIEQMMSVPSHVREPMRKTVLEFDAASAARDCTLPALFLLADRPFTDVETLEQLGTNWRVGQVVGAGHFIQLIVPDQVAAMIDRFLELLPQG
jgi:pimeloyl-ACP methyl ester carboxylesterase